MNLRGSSKRGVGIFSRVVIFFLKIRPPHTQLLWLYLCAHAVILQCLICHGLAYAITANGACLHLLSPSSCNVPLLQCFLLNITPCTTAQVGGRTFERKAPFATTSFKKGGGGVGGHIFEGGPIFERLRYYLSPGNQLT